MKITFKGNIVANSYPKARKIPTDQIIEQLNNINEVQFVDEASKQNYFDIIAAIFRELIMIGQAKALAASLKSLFTNEANEEKIREIGGTKLDLYLMNDDFQKVQQITNSIGTKDNYSLARYYRLLDIAEYAYKEEGLEFKSREAKIKLNQIEGSCPMPIWGIPYCDLVTKNIDGESKTLAVMIHNSGGITWGYCQSAYEDTITDVFDEVVRYGNGGNHISIPYIVTMLEKVLASHQNLDFVMVRISMHDLDDSAGALKDIIEKLPDNLAKQTLYIIDSCHSGQYHKQWLEYDKTSILISSSSENEKTVVSDFNPEKFLDIVKKNGLNIESFLDFFKGFQYSNPSITGTFAEGKEDDNVENYRICHEVENYEIWSLYGNIQQERRFGSETDAENRAKKAEVFKANMRKWLEAIRAMNNSEEVENQPTTELTNDTVLSEQHATSSLIVLEDTDLSGVSANVGP